MRGTIAVLALAVIALAACGDGDTPQGSRGRAFEAVRAEGISPTTTVGFNYYQGEIICGNAGEWATLVLADNASPSVICTSTDSAPPRILTKGNRNGMDNVPDA